MKKELNITWNKYGKLCEKLAFHLDQFKKESDKIVSKSNVIERGVEW